MCGFYPTLADKSYPKKAEIDLSSVTGCWFQPTPLKNDGVRQLG